MSEIRATTISNAAGTGPVTLTGQSAAKAWVNFNGTGTAAIQQSMNISSLTDLGTGVYSVSYSNVFNYTRHATVASCAGATASYDSFASLNPYPSASAQSVWCLDRDAGAEDQELVSILSHGDLA